MIRIIIASLLVLVISISGPVLRAEEVRDLETRLAEARGNDRIEILLNLTEALLNSNPKKVIEYGNEALKLLERFEDKRNELDILDNLAQSYWRLGDYENALAYGEKSLVLATEMADRRAQGMALNLLSMILIRKGDHETARNYSNRALTIFREIGEKRSMAMSLNTIGISFDIQGNYEKSLEYYLKSLEIKEELGDKAMIASTLNNVGVVYKLLGNNELSLEYYLKALKIREELGDRRRLASLYSNIGNIYLDMKNKEKTLAYYAKSLEIDREMNNQSGIASTLFNTGFLYSELSDFPRSLDYYKQSLAIREKIGEKDSIASTLIEIGNVYRQLKRSKEAIPIIQRGAAMARETGAMDILKYSSQTLAALYEDLGNFRQALHYFKEYKNTADKIMNGETAKKVAEIQAKYEADKKQKEILLLKKDNEIQKYMLNRQKMIRNMVIAAFVLLLILGVQLFRKYRYVFVFWKKKHYIGHYKILQQLGAGGMGTIYKAADITDSQQRPIAIKVMREEFFADKVQEKRFKQEASIIDQLVHPNIVKVIERGESEGSLYLAMELLEGPTLAEFVQQQKKMPIPAALNIMVQIADALNSIHAMDIIHRDLKPENIVLVEKENNPHFVKLLDFGLATTQHLSRLTQTGMVVGTIFYLSPEQLKGSGLTIASDVHALGVIFYEMLTGSKPFIGETTVDVMKQILETEPINLDRFRPGIDRTLGDLVMFMLKKDPAYRPDIKSIYTVLKELAAQHPISLTGKQEND